MRQANIFQNGEVWQQTVTLQNIADFLCTQSSQFLVAEFADILFIEEYLAAVCLCNAAEQVEEGAFTTAGWTGQDTEVAALHGEIDLVNRIEVTILTVKGFGQIFYIQHYISSPLIRVSRLLRLTFHAEYREATMETTRASAIHFRPRISR